MYWSALDSVGKALTVNELGLAARKAVGNGKYQYKKRTRKKGADFFPSLKTIG